MRATAEPAIRVALRWSSGPMFSPLQLEALREVVALAHGHRDVEWSRASAGHLDAVLKRARQGMIDRRGAKRLGEVHHISAVIAVEDDRAHRLVRRRVTRRPRQITVRTADRSLAVGHRHLALRLESARDIQRTVPVDVVNARRAEVVGTVEQDLNDLLAGEVRECLRHQRHRAADRRRGETGSGPHELSARIVRSLIVVAEGHQVIVGANPGLVREAGNDGGSGRPSDRAGNDHRAAKLLSGCQSERVRIGRRVVAGRNDEHDPRIHGALHCRQQHGSRS